VHNSNQGTTATRKQYRDQGSQRSGGIKATREQNSSKVAQQQPVSTRATRRHNSNQETHEQPGSTTATTEHNTRATREHNKKHQTGDITAGGGTAAESTTAIRKKATESTVARQRAVHRKPLLKRGSLLSGKRYF
jgi:hypothetical protein